MVKLSMEFIDFSSEVSVQLKPYAYYVFWIIQGWNHSSLRSSIAVP